MILQKTEFIVRMSEREKLKENTKYERLFAVQIMHIWKKKVRLELSTEKPARDRMACGTKSNCYHWNF